MRRLWAWWLRRWEHDIDGFPEMMRQVEQFLERPRR